MKFYLSLHKQESYLFLLLGYNTIISIEIWPMNIFFFGRTVLSTYYNACGRVCEQFFAIRWKRFKLESFVSEAELPKDLQRFSGKIWHIGTSNSRK